MAEYINRDAVHELVRSLTKYAWASPVRNEQRVTVDADDVQFGVDKIPAADVAPVRHGRWQGSSGDTCSVCGEECFDWSNMRAFLYPYCPYCNTKMDGVDDG